MIDRRVQKTLQSLHQALISLILEKGYDAVSVQDILDKANVGRSTFYSHFGSKEALLQRGLEDLRKLLSSHQRAARAGRPRDAGGSMAFSRVLFEHASGYREVYRAMLGQRAGALVTSRMSSLLAELVQAELPPRLANKAIRHIPRDAVVHYIAGALLSVLTWWVDEGDKVSAVEADAIFRGLALSSVLGT